MRRRVVLDTNVIVSALLFAGKPRQVLQLAILGHLTAVSSPVLLGELGEVLIKKFGFSPDRSRAAVEKYAGIAELVQPTQTAAVFTGADSPDNRVLEAAKAGKADFVVTGDKPFQRLGSYGNSRIVSPNELLESMS